jgi:hypothetical protein
MHPLHTHAPQPINQDPGQASLLCVGPVLMPELMSSIPSKLEPKRVTARSDLMQVCYCYVVWVLGVTQGTDVYYDK